MHRMATVTPGSLRAAADVLGIHDRASMREIEARYRALIHSWHPDVANTDPGTAHEMTIRLKEARNLLIGFCMDRQVSFDERDLAAEIGRTPREYWEDRFGDDPIWG